MPEWLTDFAAGFNGPAWTTLLISVGALIVSVVALARGRTPQPSWSLEHIYPFGATFGGGGRDGAWLGEVRQDGPGDAERVTTQVRPPGGDWGAVQDGNHAVVPRGDTVAFNLSKSTPTPGEYAVRVRFRCLPKTGKERTAVVRFTVPQL